MWRRIGYAITGALCGAAIGFLIGVMAFEEERLASETVMVNLRLRLTAGRG